MKLSIVTTLYKSSPYIDEFYARISKEAQKITDDYEIIFVDDGSPDDSLQKAVALYEKDSKVKVIELSRNFGHHKAIMTGLSHAKGEYTFLIDIDLEEEPENLNVLWKEIHKDELIDVVYGVQKDRRGNFIDKLTGNIFYKMYNHLSEIKMPKNVMTSRIMKKNYLKSLLKFKEHELTLAGVLHAAGYNQREVPLHKNKSQSTTYTLKKRISAFITAITCFSHKPLLYIFNLGMIISFSSFFFTFYLIIRNLFFDIELLGWTSLIVSVWLIGGIIIFCLGVIGIYLSKIFIEVKERPYTVVKKKYERK